MDSLDLATENITYMKWFIEELKNLPMSNDTAKEHKKISEVLDWHLKLAKEHKRNLIHCMGLSEKLNKA